MWRQVLANRIHNGFCNDGFIKLLGEVDRHRPEIGCFFKKLKEELDTAGGTSTWSEMTTEAPGIKDIYERIGKIAKALLTCLEPRPEELGLSAKDLLPILTYKGDNVLELSVKALLVENKAWTKMVDATNKAAGTSKILFPQMQDLMARLTAAQGDDIGEEGLEALPLVCEALKKVEEFRRGLKPHATQDMEASLLDLVLKVGKHIVSSKTMEAKMDADHIAELGEGLPLLLPDDRIVGLISRLNLPHRGFLPFWTRPCQWKNGPPMTGLH